LSPGARSRAIAELEVLFPSEGRGAARIGAIGLQSFNFDVDGLQVAGFGRIHFTERDLRELAEREGVGAAIADAWRKYGSRLFERIDGEYAFAIWQERDAIGLAAVDRFSSFGLFWAERCGRLAIATRPARACELLGIVPEFDARAVQAYAYFHSIPAPLSIYRGVSRLDVGQLIRVEVGRHELRQHWKPAFVETRDFEFERERDAFRQALRDGVAQCTRGVARESLGCFLSGGTDSSTIAGLVTESYGAPARTFSIVFDESQYDERKFSRLAARHFSTDHVEYVLDGEDAERAIDVLASSYEQPFGNSSAIPTLVCAQLARRAGVTRLLGGDGGDELYGGNERYATQWTFSLYENVPTLIRAGLLEPLLFGPLKGIDAMLFRKARSYVEQAKVPLPDRLGSKYNLLNRFGASNVFSEDVLRRSSRFEAIELEREVWSHCRANSQINRLLEFDFKFTLGDNDLPKVTRMCHAAGVEVAFPMLTSAVVEHSLRLAPSQKLRGRRLRYFFREALRGFLPDEIIDKPKHGFGMPFGEWVLTQPRLASKAGDALEGLESRGMLRKGFLSEVNQALRTGHTGYFGTMIWVLMALELWIRAQSAKNALASGSI